MKTRIYIGNLAYTATANDIRRLFSPFGEVAAAHVFTAGNKRFAFVLMMNESDAESAIEALNGSELCGRELRVDWANKQRPTSRRQPQINATDRIYDFRIEPKPN